jgi:alpha-L-arabinofuranosidase
VVQMASYAPLMAHVKAWQWTPDAIWFDNLRAYGTPNFYVQSVYANNVGTRVVPITPLVDGDGLYTSATLDERTHEVIVKAVNHSANVRQAVLKLGGAHASGTAKVVTLAGADLNAENSFDQPKNVAPVMSTMDVGSGDIRVEMKAWSLTVWRIPVS